MPMKEEPGMGASGSRLYFVMVDAGTLVDGREHDIGTAAEQLRVIAELQP